MNHPQPDQAIDVTVVVPTLGRVSDAQGLHDVLTALDPQPAEIIFVFQIESEWLSFQRSRPETWAKAILAPVQSATVARNAGWAAASARLVAFIDDDCRPDRRDWLRQLTHPLARENVCLVTGPVRGWATASGRLPFMKRAFMLAPPFLEPVGDPSSTRSGFCDTVIGSNFAARRSDLLAIGGFDETFESPSLYEETELSIRMRRRTGSRVWFEALAPITTHQATEGGMREGGCATTAEFVVDQRRRLLDLVYGPGLNSRMRLTSYKAFRRGVVTTRNLSAAARRFTAGRGR